MATHSQNIENLRTVTYGEQVRTSMIQLFEEDYSLVKGGIGIGTDVTSASSPVGDYVDGNVYINSDTLDVFKCNGTVWVKTGNLKGIANVTENTSTADGGVNTVTITLTSGATYNFTVRNGSKGSTGVSITDAIDNGDGTFKFRKSDGTNTASSITTIKGDKGDKGDTGATGATGAKGRDVTSITSTDGGKNHVLSANYSDGTSQVIATIKDGADGSGTGDMAKATYDTNDDGSVNLADALYDSATMTTVPAATVMNKADKATTLAGYGITDGIKAPASEGTSGQALITDGNGGRSWGDVSSLLDSVNTSEFAVNNKQLNLSTTVKNKIKNLDSNGQISASNVLDSDGTTAITQKLSKLDSDGKIDYSDVKNTPTIPTVPTNVSAFNNDSGYITDSSLDEWHKYNGSVEVQTVTSASTSTSITFHGLDTNKAYDLYFETTDGSFPTLESASLSGTELTYSVKVATVPANFKLRVIK